MACGSDILPDPAAVPFESIPTVLGKLEEFKAQLWRRWTAPAGTTAAVLGDVLLTADEAAARTGMSVDWLYRHSDALPFTRRPGRRAVRFSQAGLERWLATRR